MLGDLASHGVDLARYLLGDIDSLVADTADLPPRAGPPDRRDQPATPGPPAASWARWRTRTTCPACCASPPAPAASLEASRVAVGEQNNYGFEIHGTKGAVFWDFRRMGELGVSTGDRLPGPAGQHGLRRARRTATTRRSSRARRTRMGYDDLKVIEAYNFLRSIAEGTPHGATLDDAVRSAEALDAMAESAPTGAWVSLPH